MNRVIFCLAIFVILFFFKNISSNECCPNRFDVALTTGYVWKTDSCFKQVYGKGIQDVITFDGCYRPLDHLGVGIKTSYWQATGKTTARKKHTKIWEVPLLVYLRGIIGEKLQGYASLGGGVIFSQEKSYLGKVKKIAGIAEAEVGMNYYFYQDLYVTGAFRCLFPKTKKCGERVQLGGYGLRAGLGISF